LEMARHEPETYMRHCKYLILILVAFILIGSIQSSSAEMRQTPSLQATDTKVDYLEQGNELLNADRLSDAEALFRKAITAEPNNLLFHAQLSFSLIEQQKYREADSILDSILAKDPQFTAALWYRSLSRFSEARYEEAIRGFEVVLPLLRPDQPQVSVAHWMIATSYRKRLRQDGLAYGEVNSMVEHYTLYLKAAGASADDREEVSQYLDWVEQHRPPDNVKRWLVSTNEEDVLKHLLRKERD
jgi:tetratricopeptide (TPR) repeat protein